MKFARQFLALLAVLAAVAAAAFFIIGWVIPGRDRTEVVLTHTGPTITELEGLGHLTVVRVHQRHS
jgi:hypothetical protein